MERKLLFYTNFNIIYMEGDKFIKVSQQDPTWEREISYDDVCSLADSDQKKFIPKRIRFITPDYKDVFMLPDGGQIKITHSDGEEFVSVCKYLDDYHIYVGSVIYHICEFAERMQRIGAKVEKVEEQ